MCDDRRAEAVMGAYQSLLLPRLTDLAMRGDEIDARQAWVVSQARGSLLEVGSAPA